MDYWKDVISMAQRALNDRGELEAVSVIKNAKIEMRINSHDNWNGGIDYWDIVFKLRYKDYTALSDRANLEKILDEAIAPFHTDEFNPIANVLIEPFIERMIDWPAAYPETKESTIKLILDVKEILTRLATGKISFKEDGVEEDYAERHEKILEIAKRAGFDYPVKVASLALWWTEVRNIHSYAERREYISDMFSPLLETLRNSDDTSTDVNFNSIITKSETIKKAIEGVETFIKEDQYDSAVDRVHTAFHGYLRQLLEDHQISFTREDTLSILYNKLHDFYGKEIQPPDVAEKIKKIMRSGMGMVMRSTNCGIKIILLIPMDL